jgi:hypothetical protein
VALPPYHFSQGSIHCQKSWRLSAKKCLSYFPLRCYTYRIIYICVVSSKVAKASKAGIFMVLNHRHLSNIDCLMVHTACLVCFISTVNGRSKKTTTGKCLGKCGASSRRTTKLKQSIILYISMF